MRRTAPRVIGFIAIGAIIAALALPSVLESRPAVGSVTRGVGTVDFSYQAQGVKAPTGRKPEAAKLWFNDGSWWGVLFDRSRDGYMIYRFDWDSDAWVGTGQTVDDRNFARADVVWDGSHLYAVSGGIDPASAKHRALVSRFSYDAARREWHLDRGFPFAITDGGAETFVADKSQDGQLWVTYTRGQQVFVTHSLANDQDWTEPFPLPMAQSGDLTPDDISAVVAYDDAVGVMSKNEAGRMWVSKVTLAPAITFAGEKHPTPQQLDELHHLAHGECYIANSVKSEVVVEGSMSFA